MTSDLTSWVVDRIVESGVEEIGYVVLAALEGEDALDQYLSDGTRTRELSSLDAVLTGPEREVGGTFLKSIEVEGFRGIGPKLAVELIPEPGLTVIAGRNGSGKSSIAEALELILTGSTYRWKNRKAPWKKHWRNLHHTSGSSITLSVTEEGVNKLTTIQAEWGPSATDVDDIVVWSQVYGQPKQSLAALGWDGPLETFRPMLSYDELGGILVDGQAPLYDALSTVLGLEQLADALKRISARIKDLKAPKKELDTERERLQEAVSGVEDERAQKVALLLQKAVPELEALRDLVTGVSQIDNGPVAALRSLGAITCPGRDQVTTAASGLRSAVQAMAVAGEAASQRELALVDLRRQALALHIEHGDMPCPVCQGALLDSDWAETSQSIMAETEAQSHDLIAANESLERARAAARELISGRPGVLSVSPVPEVDEAVATAKMAWDAWQSSPESNDLELADHLELNVDYLIESLELLRKAATVAVHARDDWWSPRAVQIARWCNDFSRMRETEPKLNLLIGAEEWLKALDKQAKNERLAPIANQARQAWAKLRQESNVDLVGLELTGSATRRRVVINATVDGENASALPVMSQGELHALALALFLPRASMAASPFRFLVIDDPVQAMDPAKVDGLVDLLAKLAKTRQVIVLSHDDRLQAAIRRSRVGAHLYEIRRCKKSVVKIEKSQDPASRYLKDAFAIVNDPNLPTETARRALPGLLRMAVESAARDRFFSRALEKGASLQDVEETWTDNKKTGPRVSLALYGEARVLDSWLKVQYRNEGLGVITSGFHDGVRERSNLKDIARSVERMVKDIKDAK